MARSTPARCSTWNCPWHRLPRATAPWTNAAPSRCCYGPDEGDGCGRFHDDRVQEEPGRCIPTSNPGFYCGEKECRIDKTNDDPKHLCRLVEKAPRVGRRYGLLPVPGAIWAWSS